MVKDYWQYTIARIQKGGQEAKRKAQKLIRDMENGYQIIE